MYIFISYSESSLDGREQIPSQFLSEIPEEFIEYLDTKSFEINYLLNLEAVLSNSRKDKGQLLEASYAKELFKRQGLSVSALNNYLKCPWKFFFVNLIRLPEKIENSNLYGSAIHGALNQYLIQIKKGTKPTKEFLLKSFNEHIELLPFSRDEKSRFLERGKDLRFFNNSQRGTEEALTHKNKIIRTQNGTNEKGFTQNYHRINRWLNGPFRRTKSIRGSRSIPLN